MQPSLSHSRKDQRSEISLLYARLASVKEESEIEEKDQNERRKNDQKTKQNKTNNLLETNLCKRSALTYLISNKSNDRTQVCSENFGKRVMLQIKPFKLI